MEVIARDERIWCAIEIIALMRKMRNCAQYFFVARKMRKFAPTRKPVALETLKKNKKNNLIQIKNGEEIKISQKITLIMYGF